MNEKEAGIISKLEKKPEFALLQGLCSEIGQAQDNALNNKHKALHMSMLDYTQNMITQTKKAATAHQNPVKSESQSGSGYGSSRPQTGARPSGSNSSHSLGSSDTSQSAPPSNDFNPADWHPNSSNAMYYVKQLYYLYDKLRTTGATNPNVLIYFLEGLAKLSPVAKAGTPAGDLLAKFTSSLMSQKSPLSQVFANILGQKAGTTAPQSFSTMIAMTLVALAVYQSHGNGSKASIVQYIESHYMSGALSSNNHFLNSIQYSLGRLIEGDLLVYAGPGNTKKMSIEDLINAINNCASMPTTGGLPNMSKQFIQQLIQGLFSGSEVSSDSQGITDSQNAVRQAFEQQMLAQFNAMEKGGASIGELLQFVMMEYNLGSDNAGGYVSNISELSGLEGDASTALGMFAPGEGESGASWTSSFEQFKAGMPALYRLLNLWPTAPNIAGGAEGSLQDILSNELRSNLGSLSCSSAVIKMLPKGMVTDNGDGTFSFAGQKFKDNASFLDLVNSQTFRGLILGKPSNRNANAAVQILLTIVGYNNNKPEPVAGGTTINKRDGALDSITSSIQAVESQVSSSNETAKSEYQQANQTSANLLSTGGDIMKDMMKQLSTAVQNQRTGA